MKGVHEDRGAAAQALLNDQIFFPQGLLEPAGPALVLVVAVGAVGGVFGIGAVSMGIGIAQAKDVSLHEGSSPII